MEELIVRIQNLMSLTQTAPHTQTQSPTHTVNLGNYKFYPLKFELHFEDHKKKLSHRETQLLKILSQHRNQAIERKVILKEVWGDDSFFNSRNLDVYITKLRDYLKLDKTVQIITLKGIGYHFSVE